MVTCSYIIVYYKYLFLKYSRVIRSLFVKCRCAPSGFTLVELAIVLVIVGLLVGMGAGMVGPLTKRAKLHDTRDTVKEAYNAIMGYAAANKQLPSTLASLSVKTKDAYTNDLQYYVAANLDSSNICTTQGTYLTITDKGANKTNVAFVVFSLGGNVCNQTGTSSPFTISSEDVTVACPQDANAGYDDIVMYQDINFLREEICNSFRIVTDSLPTGTEEVTYPTSILQATDGTTSYSWTLTSGSLPAGLSLNPSGQISGTPTADGTFSFAVTVTDAESRTASRSFSITIQPNDPEINTDVLHYSSVGSTYNATIAASGGLTPYTWSISSGSLPPGLSLNSVTGQITGNLTAEGTYAFTIQISDSRGRTAVKSLSIAVNN